MSKKPQTRNETMSVTGRAAYIDVEVEVAEVLDGISTECLIEELKKREVAAIIWLDDDAVVLDHAAWLYSRGHAHECAIYLERVLPPEFRGLADKLRSPKPGVE